MAEVTHVPASERAQTFIRWFLNSYRFFEPWRQEALTNYDYVDGNQWDANDVKALKEEGRPALTFNKILPQILALGGIQRTNRFDMKALPKGSNDVLVADLMSGLLKHVEERSLSEFEQSAIFDDGNIAGLGALEVVQSFDNDLDGELLIRSLDPLQVFPDPESRRPDWDDARFVMKAPFKDPEELKFLFPEKAAEIGRMAEAMANGDWLNSQPGVDRILAGNSLEQAGRAFFDTKGQKVRVLEIQYRVSQPVWVVLTKDGAKPADSRPQAEQLALAAPGAKVEQRRVKVVRKAIVLGWEVLIDKPAVFPTRWFTIVPYIPLKFRSLGYGLVRHLRDPQNEINKRRSQVLHHINASAHSGWLNDANNGADPAVLGKVGSKPGIVVTHRGAEPKQIVPNVMPHALAQLDALADRDIKEIGVQAETMGQGTQRFISGRAIQSRQAGGLTQVTRFFDQLRMTRKIVGEILVTAIPLMYTPRRIREILDQEQTRNPDGLLSRVQGQVPGAPAGAPVAPGALDPVDQLIERALNLRFDIVVEDEPALATHRQARFQMLMQLALAFPGLIGPDEILKHSDIPNKDELIARLQAQMQQLPPGGLTEIAGRGRGNPSVNEQLDPGDMAASAESNMAGQMGPGEAA